MPLVTVSVGNWPNEQGVIVRSVPTPTDFANDTTWLEPGQTKTFPVDQKHILYIEPIAT